MYFFKQLIHRQQLGISFVEIMVSIALLAGASLASLTLVSRFNNQEAISLLTQDQLDEMSELARDRYMQNLMAQYQRVIEAKIMSCDIQNFELVGGNSPIHFSSHSWVNNQLAFVRSADFYFQTTDLNPRDDNLISEISFPGSLFKYFVSSGSVVVSLESEYGQHISFKVPISFVAAEVNRTMSASTIQDYAVSPEMGCFNSKERFALMQDVQRCQEQSGHFDLESFSCHFPHEMADCNELEKKILADEIRIEDTVMTKGCLDNAARETASDKECDENYAFKGLDNSGEPICERVACSPPTNGVISWGGESGNDCHVNVGSTNISRFQSRQYNNENYDFVGTVEVHCNIDNGELNLSDQFCQPVDVPKQDCEINLDNSRGIAWGHSNLGAPFGTWQSMGVLVVGSLWNNYNAKVWEWDLDNFDESADEFQACLSENGINLEIAHGEEATVGSWDVFDGNRGFAGFSGNLRLRCNDGVIERVSSNCGKPNSPPSPGHNHGHHAPRVGPAPPSVGSGPLNMGEQREDTSFENHPEFINGAMGPLPSQF